ncbi:aminoglycoside phosphotransferase family protein [Defluviimonas sp. SAOS-178_SWC]|uniref:aminoglycoside phosphotransferase family protein n=1 Tax=Defluviimonas sp. SAOS-178_SWC TaxID=3121287 RepID=UPI003221AC5C
MSDRTILAARFLTGAGWDTASHAPLAGDASARSYQRLTINGRAAVLMDAAPAQGESTERFARMARWLADHGYSPPALLAADHAHGFLLLEDLGDDLFARLLAADPSREAELYAAATDFLSDLHRHPAPDFVAPLDASGLAELTMLVPKWYLPGIGEPANPTAEVLPDLIGAEFARLGDGAVVTSLRDFHAENLIWLPERSGHARLGLLDFQDAVATHPAYDLVSLLQDARRDVSEMTEAAMIARYVRANGLDPAGFGAVYALLGAQRALRIAGIFARLTLRDGKPHYLAYLPRVWRHLDRNLAHPALGDLARAVHESLPAPTPERVQRIKDQCGRHPTL